MIKDFEDLCNAASDKEIAALKGIDAETIVKAYMGTSPDNAAWLEKNLPEVDFKGICGRLGRQPIAEIDKAQEYVVEKVNILICDTI